MDAKQPGIPAELWQPLAESEKDGERIAGRKTTYLGDVWHKYTRNVLAMAGLAMVILLVGAAGLGPLLLKYSYEEQDLRLANIPFRYAIYKLDAANYVFIHNDLKLYQVRKDGRIVRPLTPLMDDVFNKYQLYEVGQKTVKLDYASRPLRLRDENDAVVKVDKKVFFKAHLLGTDYLGRDNLVRVLYGARISLLVAFVAALVSLLIGVLYGGLSGYFGGAIDSVMMRIVDIISTVPLTLYVILLMVWIGPGLKSIIVAIGTVFWVGMARMVRGQVLALKENESVLAAKVMGASPWRILLYHLIPDCIGPIVVSLTLLVPRAIFTEVFLSFIGIGISPPMASWGTLCNAALSGIRSYPDQLFIPTLAICVTMFSFTFMGDGLRDALDPYTRK